MARKSDDTAGGVTRWRRYLREMSERSDFIDLEWRHCAPLGSDKRTSCSNRRICPHCYARKVLFPLSCRIVNWAQREVAAWRHAVKGEQRTCLVAFHFETSLGPSNPTTCPDTANTAAACKLNAFHAAVLPPVDLWKPFGVRGMALTTSFREEMGQFLARVGCVVAVPTHQALRMVFRLAGGDGVVAVWTPVEGRTALPSFIARAFGYDPTILKVDPYLAFSICMPRTAKSNRWTRTYGCLRSPRARNGTQRTPTDPEVIDEGLGTVARAGQ